MNHLRDAWMAAAFRSQAEDAHPRSDCPRAERIWDAARLQVSLDERIQIIDHVSECPVCAVAWSLATELATAHEQTRQPQASAFDLPAATSPMSSPPRAAFRVRNVVLLRTAALLLVALGIAFLVFRPASQSRALSTESAPAAPAPLNPAPKPPPPAAPAPVVAAAPKAVTGPTGQPQSLSVVELLGKDFVGRNPWRESLLSCSGSTRTTMLQVNDPLPERMYADADVVYYVLGGEGTLRLNGKDTRIATNGFLSVPRGASHSFERRGDRPLVLLAVLGGEPCEAAK